MDLSKLENFGIKDIVDAYNELLINAEKSNYLVRDVDIQKEMVERLTLFKQQIKSYKDQAIQHGGEDDANLLFHFQCVINSLISILELWIALKKGDHRKAWSLLIDSQEYLFTALKHPGKHFGLNKYLKKLKQIETVVFPGWSHFHSLGFIEEGAGKCSICEKDYGICDHIEGMIYWGRMCQRVNRKIISSNHDAMVRNPRDRRCITTTYTGENGITIDYITMKKLEEDVIIPKGSLAKMEGIVINYGSLDFD